MSKMRPPKHLRPATKRWWRQVANSWELEEHPLRRCAPHQPNPSVTRWHHCVRCETEATEIAMRLVPFTSEMHARARVRPKELSTKHARTCERKAAARSTRGDDRVAARQAGRRSTPGQWSLELIWKEDALDRSATTQRGQAATILKLLAKVK